MAADDLPPPDDAELLGALGDLGRRIDEAKADVDRRGAAPAPRRFPVAWLAVALLIALVSGGLVLAGGDDDGGDEIAAGGNPTTTVAEPSTTAVDPSVVGAGASTTAPPTTSAAPSTTEAPTTTAAPSTTAATTTTAAPTTTAPPSTTTTSPPADTTPPPPDAAAATDDPVRTTAPGEVTVVAGDSFWRVAEAQVTQQLGGQAPTVAQVTAYWAQLLDLNADRLVQPGNPNLILPGQVLVLPASP